MLKFFSLVVVFLLLSQVLARKKPKGKCEACKFFVEAFNAVSPLLNTKSVYSPIRYKSDE